MYAPADMSPPGPDCPELVIDTGDGFTRLIGESMRAGLETRPGELRSDMGTRGCPMVGAGRVWAGGMERIPVETGTTRVLGPGCGRGLDGLDARHVRGTTPCCERSKRVHRHYADISMKRA